MQRQIVSRQHALRMTVEAMVSQVFDREYGARVSRYPDLMIAVLDSAGQPQCAAGIRDHTDGFFSEQYLDQPAEQQIARATGQDINRTEILELASLAARRPGGLLLLLRGFTEYGLGAGYRWGLFTATKRLRDFAGRFGIQLIDLGAASASRVPDPQNWGSYYAQTPRVCAVDGQAAQRHLATLSIPVLTTRNRAASAEACP